MRYTITKVKNGLWKLRTEDGHYSEHSTQFGAEKMLLQIYGPPLTQP